MPQEKFCFFDKDAGKHGLCKPRKKSDKKQEHDKQCILNNDTNIIAFIGVFVLGLTSDIYLLNIGIKFFSLLIP